jgi:hypothetical protein
MFSPNLKRFGQMPWVVACGVMKGLLGFSSSHCVALPSKDREQACLFGSLMSILGFVQTSFSLPARESQIGSPG